jgi:phosphoesterase RecJ-like protein
MQLPITPEIATCLFTGVITDTGSFRFQNVTPPTFRIAADLIEHGAPPAHVSENVFDNRSLAATQLLGAALADLRYTPDEKVIWAVVKNEDFVRFGATDQDTEGIVNFVRGVRGADVGILFRELPDGSVRTSLRSREHVNVAVIAQQFGGGGHRMASGCTLPPPLATSEKALVDAVVKALAQSTPS